MPVRTAYVGTEAVGDVLTKANFDKLPGGWIGYAEVTANQTTITTETSLTGLTVTVTVNTSRRIRIGARANILSTVADDRFSLRIKESATVLNTGEGVLRLASVDQTFYTEWIGTPSAGVHTYNLTLQRLNGTGSGSLIAGATFPAHILVEDIGPAS